MQLDSKWSEIEGRKAVLGLGYQEPCWVAEWSARMKLETADK